MSDTLFERYPWIIVVGVVASLAAWMGLGTLHDFQHADSLLTVLISTQRWTPFFWGQDRFGMLVPLLATPIRHPLANLLAQGWMMTVAALLAPFVMARFLTGRSGLWMAIGAGANTLFLLVATPSVQFDWLVTQPYGLSISLGFAALIVADEHDGPAASVAAFVLLALACWVNIGVVVMLAIASTISGSRRVRLLTLETAAAVLASVVARYGASTHTITDLAPLHLWPHGWRQLLDGTPGVTTNQTAVVGIAIAGAIALFWLWRTRPLPPWKPAAAIVAMIVGTWLILGTSLWVAMNRYVFRYMYPTMMLAGVGVSILFAAPFAKWTKALSATAMALLAVIAIVRYGTPSLDRVNRGLDDHFGQHTAAVLHSGATVIAGDYWRVWPAVFHANLALARAHARTRVFGLAYRSDDTDALWKAGRQPVLVVGWPDDRSLAGVADEHGIAVTLLAHLRDIDLYTGQP